MVPFMMIDTMCRVPSHLDDAPPSAQVAVAVDPLPNQGNSPSHQQEAELSLLV
jgi:hypothetical protein